MQAQDKYELCLRSLKEYVNEAGYSDVVIGVSGGIDSALVTTMCVDAFGAAHVHAVILPGPYTSPQSIEDAMALTENLGIEVQIISIIEPFEAFVSALKEGGSRDLSGLALENTQARCRMVCLMALSNSHIWMMINTGNKSENMMGYSTLYGDTAGAFAPLGGLYKTDVYKLALWRNERAIAEAGIAPIPESTIERPPTAELSPDQEDEKALGMSYDMLDKILIEVIENKKTPSEIVKLGIDDDAVSRVIARIQANAFKQSAEPPYPKAQFY